MSESPNGLLVVHLGLPRTGVRVLQSFCTSNRSAFEKHGWNTAEQSVGNPLAGHLIKAFRGNGSAKSQSHFESLARLLADDPARQILLWRPWPTLAEAGSWAALQRAVFEAGRELRFTAYIREQRSWLLSTYADRVMKGLLTANANRFVQKSQDSGALDYLGLHRMLTETGSAEVGFRAFEPARFTAGDVRRDFLDFLGLQAGEFELPEIHTGVSPGAVELELARTLNGIENGAPLDAALLRRIAGESDLEGDRRLWRLVSPTLLASVGERYREANGTLAALLRGNAASTMFSEAPPEKYASFRSDELINAKSIELLFRYQKALAAATIPMVLEEQPTQQGEVLQLQAGAQSAAAAAAPEALVATGSMSMAKPIILYRPPYTTQGVHDVGDGLACEVLEERGIKRHTHIRGSFPAGYPIESQFDSGPVLIFKAAAGFTDAHAGITITGAGCPIRESVVVERLVDSYASERAGRTLATWTDPTASIVLPLATQRKENYCRWWLDSVSKIFVASRSQLLGEDWQRGNIRVLSPAPTSRFHRQTIELLRSRLQDCPWQEAGSTTPLIASTAVNSPGMTFGGGQHLGAMVRDYADFLQQLLLDPQTSEGPDSSAGELLYISRNDSDMRRILNEDELIPGLEKLGFTIMTPSKLPLPAQLAAFNRARVIVSPHGAALTNLLFCRAGTTVVEIFPEGGVHGSAFLRIASHLDLSYFFIVGAAMANRQSAKNPNNSDIVLDIPNSLALIRSALAANQT